MFKKHKIIFLISLLLLYVACEQEDCWFVHNPAGVDPPDDPWQYGGEIEIMYVRVKQVEYPNNPDPTGTTIYHSKYGGKNSSSFVSVAENTWIASVPLECDGQPYYIDTIDIKVTGTYTCVGEKFFLRLKKEGAQWVELTCIVPAFSSAGGKSAKFVFNNGQIQNSNPCSSP